MEKWIDIKNSQNAQEYIKFCHENGIKIFYIDDFSWMIYQNALQPVILPGPYEPPKFDNSQIKKLLRKAGVSFARWISDIQNQPTEWWWIICRPLFSIDLLSHKARNQIKKALRSCEIKLIDPQWLIKNGYNCYLASCKTHKKISFLSMTQWKNFINSHLKYHCFDFWGIFINNELVGYAKCVRIDKRVDLSAIWHNPDYLKYYPIYALIYTLLDYYLNKQQYEYVANGVRSIAHDTQMQEFLMTKFNFKQEYCKLNVVYSPLFGLLVKVAYPLRNIFNLLYKIIPINFLHKIIVILRQEKIRRSFL